MAVRDWWMEPPTESPGRAAENRTPQPHQPMMHRQLFQHKTYRQTLQIYACVITMYTCLQKNFLYSVFIYSQPTYIYCVVCLFVFLPLKRMSCMSHFGTLHRKEKKRKRTVCFCSFLFRQESFHLNLYKCITSCLFFLIPSWKRFLLMPKEQTSSTRLQLSTTGNTDQNGNQTNRGPQETHNNNEVRQLSQSLNVTVAFLSVSILEDNLQYSNPTSC